LLPGEQSVSYEQAIAWTLEIASAIAEILRRITISRALRQGRSGSYAASPCAGALRGNMPAPGHSAKVKFLPAKAKKTEAAEVGEPDVLSHLKHL
jgi:hypothetical protein